MPKSAAERMRTYRLRKRNNTSPWKLRPVGRPKKKIPRTTARRDAVLVNIIANVWHDLRSEGVEDISFRSVRRRANAYGRQPIPPHEVCYALKTQYGTDHFYCEGESEAGLPLKITVTDPA